MNGNKINFGDIDSSASTGWSPINVLRGDGTFGSPGSIISGLTTNRITKATSATTIGDSLIFDNGTKVMIGSTGYANVGDFIVVTPSGNYGIIQTDGVVRGGMLCAANYLQIGAQTSSNLGFFVGNGNSIITLNAAERVGIGQLAANAYVAQFHVKGQGTTSATLTAQFNDSTNTSETLTIRDDNKIYLGSSAFITDNSTFNKSIDSNGRGLYDNANNIKYNWQSGQIYGATSILSIDTVNKLLIANIGIVTTTSLDYQNRTAYSQNAVATLYWTNTGVGIYKSSPSASLHITGTSSTPGTYGIKIEDSSNVIYFSATDDGHLAIGKSSVPQSGVVLYVNESISTATTVYNLINATGTLTRNAVGFNTIVGAEINPTIVNASAGAGLQKIIGVEIITTDSSTTLAGSHLMYGASITPTLNGVSNYSSLQFSGIFVNAVSGASQSGTIADSVDILLGGSSWFGSIPTNNYGLYIQDKGFAGITSTYGIFIHGQTGSTNNYGIVGEDGNLNGLGTITPTASLHVKASTGYNQLRMETSFTPANSADANGNVGDIAWDTGFIYIKTAAGAWKRAALSAF